MRKLLWLGTLIALGMVCGAASAQFNSVTGYCVLGAKQADVSGLKSFNYLQGVIPNCTVSVFLTGTTTPATIYSNGGGTPLSSTFTANALTGQWIFYAASGQGYDVVMSGGVFPNTYPSPVTLTNMFVGGGSSGSGLNQLTGDGAAGPGTGSQVLTLTTVNAGPGSCGDATHVCAVVTDGKGRVISQSQISITGTGCAIGTCIQNAGSASQTVTQAVNTNFGMSFRNWPVSSGSFGGFVPTCVFDTYTGFTGGSSIQGSTFCEDISATFTVPGWFYAGQVVNNATGTANQTARRMVVNNNSLGVGGGLELDLFKYANQENNGISITMKTTGNAIDANAEGATPIQAKILVRGAGTSAVATSGGGSGATTITTTGIPTDNGIPIVGPSRIALDTATAITTTQTSLVNSTFGGTVAQATLGTSVTASTCGQISGGALVALTSYQITTNIATIQGSNSFWAGELIVVSNFATSTFLNGNYFVLSATGSQFTVQVVHANTGVVTEAGNAFTFNVDTPVAVDNGYTSMTFGITLGSAYVGSTTAKITVFGAIGVPEVSQLVSVGAYTGGVQYVTVQLTRPLTLGASSSTTSYACIGGSLQGYYVTNTSANQGVGNGFYNLVVGTGAANAVYEVATLAGRFSITGVYVGNVTLYPGAEIHKLTSTTTFVGSPNLAAWANGDPITFPEGITSIANYMNAAFLNDNPFASTEGYISGYYGVAPLGQISLRTEQANEDPTTLISNGGYGYAPQADRVEGFSSGRVFLNPPSNGHDIGNPQPAALDYVGCAVAIYCQNPFYTLLYKDGLGNPSGFESYNYTSGTFNFGNNNGIGTVTLQENNKKLCKFDGTDCPASAVVSVSNSDSTLTVSPTAGAVVASLNLSHANTWLAVQIINLSGGSLVTPPAGTVFRAGNVSGTASRILNEAWGSQAFFSSLSHGGTVSSPTAVTANTQVGGFNAGADNGTTFNLPIASFRIFAGENQTPSAGGSYADITATVNGTTTPVTILRFDPAGMTTPSVPGGAQGINTVNVATSYQSGVRDVDISSAQTVTNKRIQKRVVATTQSATPTINTDNGDIFEIVGLASAVTSMTTNLTGTPVEGEFMEVIFKDNATARGLTWGASFAASGTTALPTTTVVSTPLRVLFQWQTSAVWTTTSAWVCVGVQ